MSARTCARVRFPGGERVAALVRTVGANSKFPIRRKHGQWYKLKQGVHQMPSDTRLQLQGFGRLS